MEEPRRHSTTRLAAQRAVPQHGHERHDARAAGDQKSMRDNPFRDITEVEAETRIANGEPFAIRLKVPLEGTTSFEDGVYGLQERDYAETEDLVLLRSDGHPLYNLAVVCDDIEMDITHVIRGQDHLTNTHKQILIYRALGVEPPRPAGSGYELSIRCES